jgi:hypothetical protein
MRGRTIIVFLTAVLVIGGSACFLDMTELPTGGPDTHQAKWIAVMSLEFFLVVLETSIASCL